MTAPEDTTPQSPSLQRLRIFLFCGNADAEQRLSGAIMSDQIRLSVVRSEPTGTCFLSVERSQILRCC
jgi:hypothetical protein